MTSPTQRTLAALVDHRPRVIRVTVLGEAAPAGSKNSVPIHRNERQPDGTFKRVPILGPKGWPVTRSIDNCKRTKPWQAMVAAAVWEQVRPIALIEGPVELQITFYVPRRKSHFGKRGLLPSAPKHVTTWYDLDKLARAIADPLNGLVWRDDKQVCRLIVAKEWGEPARAEVTITALEDRP